MSDFTASVQYDDFKGTVAADDLDRSVVHSYLLARDLAKKSEFVVGFCMRSNSNPGQEIEVPKVVVYLCEGSFDEHPQVVRAVSVPISTAEFFSFFKRFNLVMMRKGMNFDNSTINRPNDD